LEQGLQWYGRMPPNQHGSVCFTTIKPGTVPGPDNQEQAPHLLISVFMRGLLKRPATRMYFPGDVRNTNAPIMNLVEPARRSTLIAKNTEAGPGMLEGVLFCKDQTKQCSSTWDCDPLAWAG
jgi:protocatechuate 3,4-dioxygenase alpha subunit